MRPFAGAALSGFLVVFALGCASGNRPLQLVSGKGPIYPTQAQSDQIEGWVLIQYDVSRDGQVINARVVEANPVEIFDAAALAAVRSWRFNAPRVNGQPQMARARQSRVEFRLGGTSEYDNY